MTKVKSNETAETKSTAENENTVMKSVTESYQDVSKNIKTFGANASELRSAATATARSSFSGFVSFERSLAICLRANIDASFEHARNIIQSPRLAQVADLQKNYMTGQIEMISAQTKELSDVAEAKAKEALMPMISYLEKVAISAPKAASKAK